jgi:D-alanine-D-alanine ligase-like ATP-grasp enzyme
MLKNMERKGIFLQDIGQQKVQDWLAESGMDAKTGPVVLKPAEEGSSINVQFASGIDEAVAQARDLLASGAARLVRALVNCVTSLLS